MTAHVPPNPTIRYLAVTFDCPDPTELAHFYSEALNLPITLSTDGFVLLGREGAPRLGFYRLDDYQAPTWPNSSVQKQAHLELGVDDLDAAQARLLSLGAFEAHVQPLPDRRRILLDPAGHPFCITLEKGPPSTTAVPPTNIGEALPGQTICEDAGLSGNRLI